MQPASTGAASTGLSLGKSHLPEGVEREVRIIVIGAPKTGKSSLIRRYAENSFDSDLPPQSDGISTSYVRLFVSYE
jgi:GTPase SAR1 family protein